MRYLDELRQCDLCDRTDNIIAGRWYFYCPDHKQNDWDKTYEMEIEGRENYSDVDGELAEMMLDNL